MFLPTTPQELSSKGIKRLDIILITGDTYIDSPNIGVAVIGKLLASAGFTVGIIAQPDVNSPDIARLGEPRLFWGVTGGSVDSMIANYTPSLKRRKSDDYTPGGINNRRPDRAVIVYCNLIRRYFKNTCPIIIGGLEASLRRIAHYDYWDNAIRRSILFDAKADILVYGMAERAILDLARCLADGKDFRHIQGICYKSDTAPQDYVQLPSFEEVRASKTAFVQSFRLFYENTDPLTAKGIYQRHADKFLVQNPPAAALSPSELDSIYELPYIRDVHPFYKSQGLVNALETIKTSITTHRGCIGECNFCSIAVHQGRAVVSRTIASILKEAQAISSMHDFKGYISDLGAATANMYGATCPKWSNRGTCTHKRCIFPSVCPNLELGHDKQVELLQAVRGIKGIKKAFVCSGIRYDLVMTDLLNGRAYLRELIRHHTSGQLKVAPEHSCNDVLRLMGKQGIEHLLSFKTEFQRLNRKYSLKQFLTYYLMAGHPGCTLSHMLKLKDFIRRHLKLNPEQVQIFTPTPSTYSTLMYYTGIDPFSMKGIYVAKDIKEKEAQKKALFR